jgi:hypothetical protein
MHLRLIVPADRTDQVVDCLVADDRVTNVVLLPGAAKRPAGAVVQCDVTREATSDVLAWLKAAPCSPPSWLAPWAGSMRGM